MTPENSRDEEIFNAYAAGMAVEHIQQRYGVSDAEIRSIVTAGTAGQESQAPRVSNEEIISAYGAGVAVEHIQQRYGVSEQEIRRVVATELGLDNDQAVGLGNIRRGRSALATASMIILGICGIGPCVLGAGWLVTYYASVAQYPVASWGYWNLAVGLGIAGVGLLAVIVSLSLFLLSKSRS